jgi:hypothetical protein
MDSKSRFYALEVMCRERARLADKESNYWLAEAEEWARLRQSGKQWARSSSKPSRFERKRATQCPPREATAEPTLEGEARRRTTP